MNTLIPKFRRGSSAFARAFANARKEGKKIFDYNGKSYTTRMKGESDEDWAKVYNTQKNEQVQKPIPVTQYSQMPSITNDFAQDQLQRYASLYTSPKDLRGDTRYNMYEADKDNSEFGYNQNAITAMRMALNKQTRYFTKDIGLGKGDDKKGDYIKGRMKQNDYLPTSILASSIAGTNAKFRDQQNKYSINNNNLDVFRKRMSSDIQKPGELSINDTPLYSEFFNEDNGVTFDDYKNLIDVLREQNKTNPDLVSDYVNNVFGTDWNNEEAYNYIRNYETTNPEDYTRLKNQYGQDTQGLYRAIYKTSLPKNEPKRRLRPYE